MVRSEHAKYYLENGRYCMLTPSFCEFLIIAPLGKIPSPKGKNSMIIG
jgi:hypothetical protein